MTAIEECPQYAILAPREAEIPHRGLSVSRDKSEHASLFGQMQRLRGRIALREQAIERCDLDSSGRYIMPFDEKSWHILRLRSNGTVAGCARILVHPRNVRFPGLRIASSSAARHSIWARHVKAAVEFELDHARLNEMTPIEPGGWVMDEDLRGTRESFCLALSAFAWCRILGDCLGFLTATVRHGSSGILRRLGGRGLQTGGEVIPACFEPAWGCNMELLRFDTNSLNPRFDAALAAARSRLLGSLVVSSDEAPLRRSAPLYVNPEAINSCEMAPVLKVA